jgi:hypothetical protein
LDDGRAPEGARFSYERAAALLPQVRELTEDAYQRAAALEASEAGGLSARARQQLDAIVNGWAEAVVALGAEVKGLWLVDFDNGSGYYCWRYPEDGLHYYHSYEEGFRGRLRIQ